MINVQHIIYNGTNNYFITNGRPWEYRLYLDENEEKLIMKKLKSLFPSIRFWHKLLMPLKFEQHRHFYFTNPADEAFFLLWSSEGIEI